MGGARTASYAQKGDLARTLVVTWKLVVTWVRLTKWQGCCVVWAPRATQKIMGPPNRGVPAASCALCRLGVRMLVLRTAEAGRRSAVSARDRRVPEGPALSGPGRRAQGGGQRQAPGGGAAARGMCKRRPHPQGGAVWARCYRAGCCAAAGAGSACTAEQRRWPGAAWLVICARTCATALDCGWCAAAAGGVLVVEPGPQQAAGDGLMAGHVDGPDEWLLQWCRLRRCCSMS